MSKAVETEVTLMGLRGCRRGMESDCLMGTRSLFGVVKRGVHNIVRVLTAPELYAL